MSLLAKLKSILGLHGETENAQDVGVTVERDPETEESSRTDRTTRGGSDTVDREAGSPSPDTSTSESQTDSDHARASTSESVTADVDDDGQSESSRARAQAESTGGTITEEPEQADDGTPVTEIKGIGNAYGNRLNSAGIDSVEDLAGADAASLAGETEIAEGRLEGWIEKAQNR
jgi:predicted flap endonuclease-1-like 5' DNA nuclease